MSQQDKLTRLNSLAHIPLIKSPFLRVPAAVTLPYNYVQLPNVQSIPAPRRPSETLYNEELLTRELTQYDLAEQQARAWQEGVEQRRLQHARKLAPGFLDTGVSLLMPTRSSATQFTSPAVPAPAKTEEETFKDYFEGLKF